LSVDESQLLKEAKEINNNLDIDNENNNNSKININEESIIEPINKYEKKNNLIYESENSSLRKNKTLNNKRKSSNNNLKEANSKEEIKKVLDKKDLTISEKQIENFNSIKYQILVVDDNKTLRQSLISVISKFLKKRNLSKFYEIIECSDGVDILSYLVKDQAENNKIKCVITDENMEYMNGSEAIKILKNFENDNKIKPVVLAMISSFDIQYMENYFNVGDEIYFLPKPCNEKNFEEFFEVL